MHRIAQSWLVLEITGDARMLGFVVAAQFAPMLFLAPWAGVLADRYDRRRLLQLTQIGMGLQALALGLLTLACFYLARYLAGSGATPFIYFQF